MMRKLCKNSLRVFKEIEERACVHCFCLAKPLGKFKQYQNSRSAYLVFKNRFGEVPCRFLAVLTQVALQLCIYSLPGVRIIP